MTLLLAAVLLLTLTGCPQTSPAETVTTPVETTVPPTTQAPTVSPETTAPTQVTETTAPPETRPANMTDLH